VYSLIDAINKHEREHEFKSCRKQKSMDDVVQGRADRSNMRCFLLRYVTALSTDDK